MDYLNNVSSLNMRANQRLEFGDFHAAFNDYRSAIRELAIVSNRNEVTTAKETLAQMQPAAEPLFRRVVLSPVICSSHSQVMNHVFLFSPQDVIIHGTTNGEGETTTELVALYSAILILNCAVCLHRNGSEKAMCKALTLYMQSWQLLEPMFSSPCSWQVFGFDCSDLWRVFLGIKPISFINAVISTVSAASWVSSFFWPTENSSLKQKSLRRRWHDFLSSIHPTNRARLLAAQTYHTATGATFFHSLNCRTMATTHSIQNKYWCKGPRVHYRAQLQFMPKETGRQAIIKKNTFTFNLTILTVYTNTYLVSTFFASSFPMSPFETNITPMHRNISYVSLYIIILDSKLRNTQNTQKSFSLCHFVLSFSNLPS